MLLADICWFSGVNISQLVRICQLHKKTKQKHQIMGFVKDSKQIFYVRYQFGHFFGPVGARYSHWLLFTTGEPKYPYFLAFPMHDVGKTKNVKAAFVISRHLLPFIFQTCITPVLRVQVNGVLRIELPSIEQASLAKGFVKGISKPDNPS